MSVKLDAFTAEVNRALDNAAQETTLDDSVVSFLNGQAAATQILVQQKVSEALAKDNTDTQAIIDAATTAVSQANATFVANRTRVSDALTANTPAAPAPPPAV